MRYGLLLLLLAIAWPARAHHDSAVTRLDLPRTPPPTDSKNAGTQWLSAAAYEFARYGRVLGASDRVLEDGTIDLHVVALQSQLRLSDFWSIEMMLPFGVSTSRPSDGESLRTTGLGDLNLRVTKGWDQKDWGLRAAFGATLPTGRYEPSNSLSVAELVTSGQGGLDLVTFDTRASLGADTVALHGAASAWRDAGAARLHAEFEWVQPLTETSDEILWGADAIGRVGVLTRLGDSFFDVALDYRRHLRDRLSVIDEAGTVSRERLGGRDDLGVRLDASTAIASGVRCGVGARVPMWQRAGSVQLAQSFSTSLRCGVEVDL
ncbi:MAG: transporter [Myxococcota bacterium]